MNVKYNHNLSPYNSYCIDATCRRAFFPENEKDLIEAVTESRGYVILGKGCNVILSRASYDDMDFIILRDNFSAICQTGEGELSVLAGTDLKYLSVFAYQHSLSGLEVYYDIPGTVGGGIVMNAGANGMDFSQIIKDVTVFNPTNNTIETLNVVDLRYDYRGSLFQDNKNLVVLSARIHLKPDSRPSILDKMLTYTKDRWAKQPREYPSAGSVFKRPKGYYVGPMVESLGLKGFRVGGAEVSRKHAGFIINTGNATGSDILNLVKIVQEKVFDAFGVHLSLEQRVI